MELSIACSDISNDDLIDALEAQPGWKSSGIHLELRRRESSFRGIDPTVLVAIVTGSASVLTTLVSHLVTAAKRSDNGEIIIKASKDGVDVRLPANADLPSVTQAVEALQKLSKSE